jgi:hypothetical protein
VFGNLFMSQRQHEPSPISRRSSLNGPIQQEFGHSFEYGSAEANRIQLFARSFVFPAQVDGHTLEKDWVLPKELLKVIAGDESNLARS